MEPAVQTKSRKPFYVWIAIFSVPAWSALCLAFIWDRFRSAPDIRGVMVIFGIASAVCVAVILSYLLLPHRRGPYAVHLVGAAIGGLTAISLAEPVFGPLIRVQMELTEKTMLAAGLDLIVEWYKIMDPYGGCIEVVLIGMATGWMCVLIASKLKTKQWEGKA